MSIVNHLQPILNAAYTLLIDVNNLGNTCDLVGVQYWLQHSHGKIVDNIDNMIEMHKEDCGETKGKIPSIKKV